MSSATYVYALTNACNPFCSGKTTRLLLLPRVTQLYWLSETEVAYICLVKLRGGLRRLVHSWPSWPINAQAEAEAEAETTNEVGVSSRFTLFQAEITSESTTTLVRSKSRFVSGPRAKN